MASKILATRRTAKPTLVPLDGYDRTKLVRSDPTTHHVDAIHAFQLVLGEEAAQPTLSKLLAKLDAKPNRGFGFDPEAVDLSRFTRVRWAGNKGRESIVAPLHVVVQCLMMLNSGKTKGVRAAAAKTTLRAAGGDRTLADEVQRTADALDGTATQAVLLNDTRAELPATAATTAAATSAATTATAATTAAAAAATTTTQLPAPAGGAPLALLAPNAPLELVAIASIGNVRQRDEALEKYAFKRQAVEERRTEAEHEQRMKEFEQRNLAESYRTFELLGGLDDETRMQLRAAARAASGITCCTAATTTGVPVPTPSDQLRLGGGTFGHVQLCPAGPPVLADVASKFTVKEAVTTHFPDLARQLKPTVGEWGQLGKATVGAFAGLNGGRKPDEVNGSKKADVNAATNQSTGYAVYWYTAAQVNKLLPVIQQQLHKLLATKRRADSQPAPTGTITRHLVVGQPVAPAASAGPA